MRPLSTGSRRLVLINCCCFLVLAVSILWRLWSRQDLFAGWDLIGPAKGHYLLSTQPFVDSIWEILQSTRSFQYWNHGNSLIFTLVPGFMNIVFPWQYWSHALTFVMWFLSLALVCKTYGLNRQQLWLPCLAFSASSTLLAFSIAGYPYITGFLPFACALALIRSKIALNKPFVAIALAALTCELSWHLYETGKFVFGVLILAAVLAKNQHPITRIGFVAVAIGQVIQLHFYGQSNINFWAGLERNETQSWFHTFSDTTLQNLVLGNVWTPFLFLGALCSLFLRKRNLLFSWALFLFATSMLGWLVYKGGFELRGRRTLSSDGIFLAIILDGFQHGVGGWLNKTTFVPGRATVLRTLCVFLLILGNFTQLLQMYFFSKRSAETRSVVLPGTFSQLDYGLYHDGINAARWIIEKARQGNSVVLVYNLDSYPENTTDPAAIIERIYLSLGHKQFDDHVFVYGRNKSRYIPLPIRDFDEYKMVHSLRQRAVDKPAWLVEYVGGGQSKIFFDERTQVMTAISKSFRTEILDQLVIGRDFRVYKIHVGSQDLAYLQ